MMRCIAIRPVLENPMKTLPTLAALAWLLLGPGAPAAAQHDVNSRLDTVFGEHETFAAAYGAFTTAVKAGDAATVASLVKYPFAIAIGGEDYIFTDESEFTGRYEDIFTPAIVDLVDSQAYDTLFVNQDGVMFGDGQIWFTAVCTNNSCSNSYWVVSAINIPE